MTPLFTARTTFRLPQQRQRRVASAPATRSGSVGLAGAAASTRSPADPYVVLLQIVTDEDRLTDQVMLKQVYDTKYHFEARRALKRNSHTATVRKDRLCSADMGVDDEIAQRAADTANAFVEPFRRMTTMLVVSGAQQRRLFFEMKLKTARDQLAKAKQELQASRLNAGALRAELKAAAETYARSTAEITAAVVRIQVLRGSLADNAPEVQRQLAPLGALRAPLTCMEQAVDANVRPGYLSKSRELKYRETLFRPFARPYEIALVDKSRWGRPHPGGGRRRAGGMQEQAAAGLRRGGGHVAELAAVRHVHADAPFLAPIRSRSDRCGEGRAFALRVWTALSFRPRASTG